MNFSYSVYRLAVSLTLLLLLSGDVETNPGPDRSKIPPSFLSELVKLPLAAKWKELGIQLGVPKYKLDEIQLNNHNKPSFAQQCFTDVFNLWFDNKTNTTFVALAKVLHTLEVIDAGKEILCPAYAPSSPFEKNMKFSMASKWKDVGHELGVTEDILDGIKQDQQKHSISEIDSDQWCFLKTLELWKKGSPTAIANLQIFIKALHGLGEHDMEKEMKEIHFHNGNIDFYKLPESRPELPECIVRYSEYLREIYLAQPVLSDSDWPPSLGGQFIRLALIPRQRGVYADKYESIKEVQKDYVRGNVDKILAGRSDEKTEMQTTQILKPLHCFAGGKLSLRVLIDGAPGVGKTTLSRKFTQDWANGVLLQDYDLVVLLHLRDRSVSQASSIDDFFYHDDPDIHQSVVRHIRKTSGKRVLLIFDGFDELSAAERSRGSFFMNIIEGKVLTKCSVVVTSRPYASVGLQELSSINRHIEVLGFTEKMIKECIMKTIIDNPEKAQELCTQLHERLDIMSLCYIPLNCAIMLFVYQQENFVLPKTLTELYNIFALHAIKRHTRNIAGDTAARRIRSIEKLPKEIETPFSVLCRLAYDSLIKDQLVFHEDDIVDSFPDIGDQDIERQTLALMTVAKSYSKRGREVTCNFLHLTIQEFLAAKWAVANISLAEMSKFLRQNINNDRLRMMLLFVAGIAKHNFPRLDEVFARDGLSVTTCPPNYSFLLLCHFVYESESTTAATHLTNLLPRRGRLGLELSHMSLTEFEFLVVITFFVQSETQWDFIKLNCKEQHLKMYLEVSNRRVRVNKVKLQFNGDNYAELLHFVEKVSMTSDIELDVKSRFSDPRSITTLLSLIKIVGQSLLKLSFLSLAYTQFKPRLDKIFSLSSAQLTDSQFSEALLFFLHSGYHWNRLSLKCSESCLKIIQERIDTNEISHWNTSVNEIGIEYEGHDSVVISDILEQVCEPLNARVELIVNWDTFTDANYVKLLLARISCVKMSRFSLKFLSVVYETSITSEQEQVREISLLLSSSDQSYLYYIAFQQLSAVLNFLLENTQYSWDLIKLVCDDESLTVVGEAFEIDHKLSQIKKMTLEYNGQNCRFLLQFLQKVNQFQNIKLQVSIEEKSHGKYFGTDCLPKIASLENVSMLSCLSISCENIILNVHSNTHMEELHVMFHSRCLESLKNLLSKNSTLLVLEIVLTPPSNDVYSPIEALILALEKPLLFNRTLTKFTITWNYDSILFKRNPVTSKLVIVQNIDKSEAGHRSCQVALRSPVNGIPTVISVPSSLMPPLQQEIQQDQCQASLQTEQFKVHHANRNPQSSQTCTCACCSIQ